MTETLAEVIGKNIRRLRKDRGIKQYALAEKIRVDPCNFNRWEKGVVTPSVYYLCEIAKALECSIDEICGIK